MQIFIRDRRDGTGPTSWLRLLRERDVQGHQGWVRREAELALARRNEDRLRVVPVFVADPCRQLAGQAPPRWRPD